MSNATILVLAALGLIALLLPTLARESSGRLELQIARLEGKIDLILTHLGLSEGDSVPEIVVGLARAGRKIEAIKEYRKATGASLAAAKLEVELIMARGAKGNGPA